MTDTKNVHMAEKYISCSERLKESAIRAPQAVIVRNEGMIALRSENLKISVAEK